jgi:hypothetical protein
MSLRQRKDRKKARTMFEEMDLQWDLDELDKVMAEGGL